MIYQFVYEYSQDRNNLFSHFVPIKKIQPIPDFVIFSVFFNKGERGGYCDMKPWFL